MKEIKYSEKAVKQIKKIHKGDRKNAEMILKAIEAYAENIAGRFDVKILKGNTETSKGSARGTTESYSMMTEMLC